MRKLTASALWRADNCPASCALPYVGHASSYVEHGVAGHKYLEQIPKVGEKKALESIPPEHREFCAQIQLDGLPLDGSKYYQEIAFAIDGATWHARSLGSGLNRNYPALSSDEIPGTIDVYGVDGDTLLIEDYKFDGFDSNAPPPRENHQLKFAAVCAGRITGVPNARVRLIHIRPDGSNWMEHADLDIFDMDAFTYELTKIQERVKASAKVVEEGRVPDVHRGPWCRHCGAAPHCPAVLDLIKAASAEPHTILALANPPVAPEVTAESLAKMLTPESAAKAYERMRQLESALNMAKQALYFYATETPIDAGDGYVYGPVRVPSKEWDARIVRRELLRLYGPEVCESACDFDTSESAIERALRPVLERKRKLYEESRELGEKPARPTMKALKEAAIEAIEKAGGIKRGMKEKIIEHRAQAQESEAA